MAETDQHTFGRPRPRAAERRELIVRTVSADGTVTVEELARTLGVTPSTIRRDLALLTERGTIARTYGGAITAEHVPEQSLGQRASLAVAQKGRIAAWAAGRVAAGDTVILDGGTTTGLLARQLRTHTELTVVTNSLTALGELNEVPGVEVISLGGQLRQVSQAFVGPLTELSLSRLSADKVFLGADGIDAARGICEASFQQTALKELMAERSTEVYILADSSKLGQAPFTAWAPGPLRRPWTLVTDSAATPDRLAPFHDLPTATVITV
ncbi:MULTISPECIES: DeoR/GlpR family DNA-binding transcription regulator [Streptomyces]|uniref:DeoR/GlpR family DNA-binding transcription regulator n=1 Tax=Streptomyces TaxID=1883 RepID=UPI0021CFD0DD|nr:DeoR/GlpR family DNA-binding transcription regulator [Streptomyces sp. G-5]MCU4747981.1 DeoR/GlpR family DNA-binding transcription regulator [Streptomyces sp. G-5]